MIAMESQGVTTRFSSDTALNDLDLVRPTAASVAIIGNDLHTESAGFRQGVGVLPDSFHVYARLPGRQHVKFTINSTDTSDDPGEVGEQIDIVDAADRKTSSYGKVMKQQLILGMVLVDRPGILIRNELAIGLDSSSTCDTRESIREENDYDAIVEDDTLEDASPETLCMVDTDERRQVVS